MAGSLEGLRGSQRHGFQRGVEVCRHNLRGDDPAVPGGADLLLLPPLLPPQQAPPEGPDTRPSYNSRSSTHDGRLPHSQHRIPTAASTALPSYATRVPATTTRVPFAAAWVPPYATWLPRQPSSVPWATVRTGGS